MPSFHALLKAYYGRASIISLHTSQGRISIVSLPTPLHVLCGHGDSSHHEQARLFAMIHQDIDIAFGAFIVLVCLPSCFSICLSACLLLAYLSAFLYARVCSAYLSAFLYARVCSFACLSVCVW